MRKLALVSLLVPEYDEGIAFFTKILGFELAHDIALGDGKRWVVVRPTGAQTGFVLARAQGKTQRAMIGQQGGGRVWLFLETDNFARDHASMQANGVIFEEEPRAEPYGQVAVFRDPFGNRWDLIEYCDT